MNILSFSSVHDVSFALLSVIPSSSPAWYIQELHCTLKTWVTVDCCPSSQSRQRMSCGQGNWGEEKEVEAQQLIAEVPQEESGLTWRLLYARLYVDLGWCAN